MNWDQKVLEVWFEELVRKDEDVFIFQKYIRLDEGKVKVIYYYIIIIIIFSYWVFQFVLFLVYFWVKDSCKIMINKILQYYFMYGNIMVIVYILLLDFRYWVIMFV